jgi:hypothetical protein
MESEGMRRKARHPMEGRGMKFETALVVGTLALVVIAALATLLS